MSLALDPEIERRVLMQVESGRFASPSQVVEEGLDLLDRSELKTKSAQLRENIAVEDSTAKSRQRFAWEEIVAIGESIPIEEWDKVPSDLSKNLDHYLYGSPKISE
jgi:putative addiction module CopG family antidote